MALSENLINRAAEFVAKGRLQPSSPIGYPDVEWEPVDTEDSMAIQDALHILLTANGYGTVLGTKIGCTTKVMQDYLGVPHPCAGGIFDTTVQHGIGKFGFNSIPNTSRE